MHVHFHTCQAYHGTKRCTNRGYPMHIIVPDNVTMVVWLCQDCAEYLNVRETT